ncbi:MAG TPA: hypothetical protein VH500_05595 [Nitrososphaeraceae archaeon]|jgi:hypothetical protein
MSSQRSIYYDNSIRTRYSLDVIAKVLKTEGARSANVNENNDDVDIPEIIIDNKIDFLICNTCFWCASIYSTTNNISRINCSVCNDTSNLESMPISKDESFRINYNPKAGIVLEFSR